MEFEFANPQQKEFFEAGPNPTLFLSGYGGGKTVIGIIKLLYLLDLYPGSRGAIVRRSFSQLIKTTGATLRQWLPATAAKHYNENTGIIRMPNGSVIYMLYLDGPDSLNVLRGLEVNFVFVDQVEELSEEAWDLLDTRTGRWSGAKMTGGFPEAWPHKDGAGRCLPPKYLFAAANSPGYESWVWRRFSPDSPESDRWQLVEGYKVVIASSRNNKFLGEANLKTLLSKGEEFARRFVDATDWGVSEGLIVTVDPSSIIDPDMNPTLMNKIHTTMKLHRSMDHGETAPTCVAWEATDFEGNIFVYREYYVPNALVSQHRYAVFELSKQDAGARTEDLIPRYYSQIADPSIFNKSRGRTLTEAPKWSVADEWSDTKIMPPVTSVRWVAGDNGEEATRSRMKEYLNVDPTHMNPLTGALGSPRLFFIKKTKNYPMGCLEIIKDIKDQKHVAVGVGSDGRTVFTEERDPKIRDHGWDAVKYFVVSRPSLGVGPTAPKLEPGQLRVSDYDEAVKSVAPADKMRSWIKRGWGR